MSPNGHDKPEPKLDLLIKLLGMTDSIHDGEALSAMRKANNFLKTRLNSDWESLLRGKVTIIEDPFNSNSIPRPESVAVKRPPPPAPTPPRPTPPPKPKPPDPFAGLTPIYDKNTYHIREHIRVLSGAKYDAKQKVWYVRPSDIPYIRTCLAQLPPRPKRGSASTQDILDDLGL